MGIGPMYLFWIERSRDEMMMVHDIRSRYSGTITALHCTTVVVSLLVRLRHEGAF